MQQNLQKHAESIIFLSVTRKLQVGLMQRPFVKVKKIGIEHWTNAG